jgi:hypothetical protein
MIDDVSPYQGFPSKICRATLPFYGTGKALTKAKGKCYSMIDRGQRKPSDLYETPTSITQQFLDAEQPNHLYRALHPAKGKGAMLRVLDKYYVEPVCAYDIEEGTDFLEEKRAFDYIIENPPYRFAYEFIQKAKEVASYGFAFLLPLSYLHGQQRYENIWTDKKFPLAKIYVFTRYPMLGDPIREDGKYRTGMCVYAWFVWARNWRPEHPEIHWIDNNRYVLKKGE